jgi:hypothetical protein
VGLTHLGDVVTHVLIDKPVDGVRAVKSALAGQTRSQRRKARAERLAAAKQEKEAARLVEADAAKTRAAEAKLRQAKLQMETGQRLAAAGAEELNRLKAESVLAESAPATDTDTTTKTNNNAPAKGADDPAPAPKTRAQKAPGPNTKGTAGDVAEAKEESEASADVS